MKLNYKILGADLLIFKNLNDCLTLTTANSYNALIIKSIELNGESLNVNDLVTVNRSETGRIVKVRPESPFTDREILDAYDLYEQLQKSGVIQ
jgi:hypothetical protein